MSKNNNKPWNTKFGSRRVRNEAPTLGEAIAAAQGLSDELDEQAEIAASLIGLPRDQVRTELFKVAAQRKNVIKSVAFTGAARAQRTVVVERKDTRPHRRRACTPARAGDLSPAGIRNRLPKST